jgi:hypothetical protein
MLLGYHGVDGPQMSADEAKETLRREMVAEMNTEMMDIGMDTKESLRREIMAEINRVLMGAGQDTKEYLREEMAAEIKAALKGVAMEESRAIMNPRDDFRRDPVSTVNIVIAGAADVVPRGRKDVGKEVTILDS